MTKTLKAAALALAEEASESVEISEWPELQNAIAAVREAAEHDVQPEQRVVTTVVILPGACEYAFRFASGLHQHQPPRLHLVEESEAMLASLVWKNDTSSLLIMIDDEGEASWAITYLGTDMLEMVGGSFHTEDDIPPEIGEYLGVNFLAR